MSDYPRWFCNVICCDYSTTYSKNIRKHLNEVHGLPEKNIEKELDKFWKAFEHNLETVNKNSDREGGL